ncbi:RodZ domain-containing protein [Shewanella amazonensis]|uniref:HTH cro/C1-type domain-containing protein n=1 Tax=Shewanella amazonensis (strain ATCC BAA-1098 / SB2B) TaxID=326297 RepID=A1S864_SHEAM|nr:RodZ domain-containing protein [Shewanella amazonensis]ABM00571.1 conserved hypothetical protein [Shewanella amazonensis SB2B]
MNEELTPSSEEQEAPATESLGQILKAAREAKGMSVADVATALHLRPSVVKDLEADDFSNISSATYIRGYIKNFARIVEADKQKVEACLASQVPGVSQPAMQSFSRKTVRQARDKRYLMLTYLVILILVALLVFWWLQTSKFFNTAAVDFSKPTAEEVAAAGQTSIQDDLMQRLGNETHTQAGTSPQPDTEAAYEQSVNSDDMPVAAQEVTVGSAEEPSAQQDNNSAVDTTASDMREIDTRASNAEATPEVTASIPATPGQSALVMSFSADCWVQVKDATGKVLVSDLRKAGQTINLSGKAPFSFILGAPQAVKLSINGEAASLDEFPKGRVARFSLPKNG